MALTRKFLQQFNLDDDQINEIISAHMGTVDALKEERDGYKSEAEKVPELQGQLKAAEEKAGKIPGMEERIRKLEEVEKQHGELRTEFDKYKADVEARRVDERKKAAYGKLLRGLGISDKRLEPILRVTDLGKLELDDSGALKEADRLSSEARESWGEFIPVRKEKGAEIAKPPKGDGSGGPSRAAQIAARHYEALYGGAGKED